MLFGGLTSFFAGVSVVLWREGALEWDGCEDKQQQKAEADPYGTRAFVAREVERIVLL
jgi:hypothetical protein